ncbi:hypothetical protein [Sinomonas humi]|nr:hypothetical protein [Sinomonas humi]
MSPEHRKPDNEHDPGWETDEQAIVSEQRRRFGGMKAGSAFFGWLSATGMSVLLTALLTGAGAGIGIGTQTDPTKLAGQAAPTVGIVGAIAVAVILFVSYYCGGYVAGRMARFDGARQGVAVWLWAVVIAIVIALLALAAGARFNVLSSLNSFPRIPVDEGTLTTGGIIVLIVGALITLAGAVLGGAAGMRYHRRIDRTAIDL